MQAQVGFEMFVVVFFFFHLSNLECFSNPFVPPGNIVLFFLFPVRHKKNIFSFSIILSVKLAR